MNEELLLAIEELRRRPRDRAWFIPVLLDACMVPDIPIGAGETLRDIQWIALHQDWNEGIQTLIRAINVNAPKAVGPTVAIMVTDLGGVTSLLSMVPHAEHRKLLSDVAEIQRNSVSAHGGLHLQSPTETVLAGFASALSAVECAFDIQSSFFSLKLQCQLHYV